jgi:hypothetical protein
LERKGYCVVEWDGGGYRVGKLLVGAGFTDTLRWG